MANEYAGRPVLNEHGLTLKLGWLKSMQAAIEASIAETEADLRALNPNWVMPTIELEPTQLQLPGVK